VAHKCPAFVPCFPLAFVPLDEPECALDEAGYGAMRMEMASTTWCHIKPKKKKTPKYTLKIHKKK